jgi:hypothetical protein
VSTTSLSLQILFQCTLLYMPKITCGGCGSEKTREQYGSHVEQSVINHSMDDGSYSSPLDLMANGTCVGRRIPYAVALKRNHEACAALLNPSAAEPMVWPSPFKFISELEPEAKALLEAALTEANREREEKILRGTKHSPHPPTWDHASDAADADAIDDASSDVCFVTADKCGT